MSVVQETYATKVAITRAATIGLKLRASTTATSTCIGSYQFQTSADQVVKELRQDKHRSCSSVGLKLWVSTTATST